MTVTRPHDRCAQRIPTLRHMAHERDTPHHGRREGNPRSKSRRNRGGNHGTCNASSAARSSVKSPNLCTSRLRENGRGATAQWSVVCPFVRAGIQGEAGCLKCLHVKGWTARPPGEGD